MSSHFPAPFEAAKLYHSRSERAKDGAFWQALGGSRPRGVGIANAR
jgi:hypothetical protein